MKICWFLFVIVFAQLPKLMAQHAPQSRIELVRFDMDTFHLLQDTLHFFPDSNSNLYTATIFISLDTFAAKVFTFFEWRLRIKNNAQQKLEFISINNSPGSIIGENVLPRTIYPFKELDLTGIIDNNKFSGGHFNKTITYYFDAENIKYTIFVVIKGYKKIVYN